jgi:serine/threonine protein phosphatase PrpC
MGNIVATMNVSKGLGMLETKWSIVSGTVTGRSHEKKGLPCQDKVYKLYANEVAVIVLADGAGSSPYSDQGAAVVSEAIAWMLSDCFDELIAAGQIIQTALQAIEELPGFDKPIGNYASTLLFAAVKGDTYFAGHLGDGVIGLEQAGEAQILSFPDNGEFVNTTYFTTTKDAQNRLRLYYGESTAISGFILMSDGAAESLYNRKEQQLAVAVSRLWDWMREHSAEVVEKALQSNMETLIREQTTDDCAVALMCNVMSKHGYEAGHEVEEGERTDRYDIK